VLPEPWEDADESAEQMEGNSSIEIDENESEDEDEDYRAESA
jgi:hypothetical protein